MTEMLADLEAVADFELDDVQVVLLYWQEDDAGNMRSRFRVEVDYVRTDLWWGCCFCSLARPDAAAAATATSVRHVSYALGGILPRICIAMRFSAWRMVVMRCGLQRLRRCSCDGVRKEQGTSEVGRVCGWRE